MEAEILAGPILRRTTKNRVCVWLASSEPMSLQLTVMDEQERALGLSQLESLTEQRVCLGANLYVYLLQARSNNEEDFPLDTLLFYRLDKVDLETSQRAPLFSEDEGAKLVYGSLPYPSFFIPTKLKHLLHGSCRKPHGGFDAEQQAHLPDALSHGHTLLTASCNDLEQRPSVLLLTGDQIYADDVSISLLAMLRQKSLTLTGKQEMLPLSDSDLSSNEHLDSSTIPLHGRKQVLNDKHNASGHDSGFSSGESENHLLTFAEFAAMYIYVLGNLPAWEPVWDWQQLAELGVAEGAKEAWAKQLEPLSYFDNTLPDVRRLLANVSTYMTFDDHDVTDDWNITLDWYEGVRKSPLGRRIVSNALASFWGFQAWGNDPDNFDKDLIFSIKQHLNDQRSEADIAERYDLHLWKSRGWGFSIPTHPPIIAIDSRTQRQYDNKYSPAQLLDRYSLDWLRVEWAKLKTGQKIDADTCPVFIAATPVVGYSNVENIQNTALWLTGKVESYVWIRHVEKLFNMQGVLTGWMVNKLDAESWSSNKEGFVRFMDTLCMPMSIKRCVFLSGDVHYAFTAKASYKHIGQELDCYQLTSSALSNEPDAKQSRFLENGTKDKDGVKIHRHWAMSASQRWTTEVQLLQVENSELRVNAKCNLGLVKFGNGVPLSHTLLTGNDKLTYRLLTT